MRLHMGHSLVDPKHRNQHWRQHVCQHPVDTVGSSYGSRHILHTGEVEGGVNGDASEGVTVCSRVVINSTRSACFLAAIDATCRRAGFSWGVLVRGVDVPPRRDECRRAAMAPTPVSSSSMSMSMSASSSGSCSLSSRCTTSPSVNCGAPNAASSPSMSISSSTSSVWRLRVWKPAPDGQFSEEIERKSDKTHLASFQRSCRAHPPPTAPRHRTASVKPPAALVLPTSTPRS